MQGFARKSLCGIIYVVIHNDGSRARAMCATGNCHKWYAAARYISAERYRYVCYVRAMYGSSTKPPKVLHYRSPLLKNVSLLSSYIHWRALTELGFTSNARAVESVTPLSKTNVTSCPSFMDPGLPSCRNTLLSAPFLEVKVMLRRQRGKTMDEQNSSQTAAPFRRHVV